MQINTVYFLDDEPDICEAFEIFFEGEDFAIWVFTDHEEAIMQANSTPPDLMFIDYRLNGTTGEKVAELLPASITKIMLTGELDMEPSEQFFGLVSKPYKLTELAEYISTLKD